jgi:hypothetical protein
VLLNGSTRRRSILADQIRAGSDRAAITTIVITVTETNIVLVLENVGIGVIGHHPERSIPTETDHHRGEKNLTGRGHLCAPDPQNHEGIANEMIVDVDGAWNDQLMLDCPFSSG